MTRPTDRLLDHLAARLEATTVAPVQLSAADEIPRRTTPALNELMRRARHLVRAAATASSTPDGYPTKTPGASDPTETWRPCPERGCAHWQPCPEHSVELTTVEAAADARQHTPTDDISQLAKELMTHLADAVKALEAAQADVDRGDRLRAAGEVPEPPQCYVAARYGLPWDPEWEPYKTTDFRSKIDEPFDEPRRVSSFVYWFVWNNSHLRRLPTKHEMLKHLERGVVKVGAA